MADDRIDFTHPVDDDSLNEALDVGGTDGQRPRRHRSNAEPISGATLPPWTVGGARQGIQNGESDQAD